MIEAAMATQRPEIASCASLGQLDTKRENAIVIEICTRTSKNVMCKARGDSRLPKEKAEDTK